MSDVQRSTSGFIAFALIFVVILAALIGFESAIARVLISSFFSNYEMHDNVLPNEWVVIGRDVSPAGEREAHEMQLQSTLKEVQAGSGSARGVIEGKLDLHQYLTDSRRTHYFINPVIAFLPLLVFIAGAAAFLISMFFPGTSSLSWIRTKVIRAYEQMESSMRKQSESHATDFEYLMALPTDEREEHIRNSTLPEVVIAEIHDLIDIRNWVRGMSSNPLVPLKFYFRYRISTVYANLIQGLVSGGAAILIFIIGLRGLKFIPPEEPSLILMALSVEFIMLVVLMFTFAGSAQEERLDRVVKELEAEQRDAIKQQTETLRSLLDTQEQDGGGAAAESIAEYEERKILDELLSIMIREAGKRRS